MRDLRDWSGLYGHWDEPIAEPIPGYTILMMVPADLPVFAELALRQCAAQDPAHRVETLVVPDMPTPAFSKLLDGWTAAYPAGPLRQVNLRPIDLHMMFRMSHPHLPHWLQWLRGIEATRTTHAVLHDADLFFADPGFLRTHYETCLERNLACLGVSQAWESWYEEHGITHLAATWELLFRVDWARAYPPTEHWGHDELVAGESHYFDLTHWPQYRTPPHLIDRRPLGSGFVHFTYVIGRYRQFQRSEGPFEDDYFRLLLTRLLVDACGLSGFPCDIPPLAELAEGMTDDSSRVTYRKATTLKSYRHWRDRLQILVDSLLSDEEANRVREGVRAFDQALRAK